MHILDYVGERRVGSQLDNDVHTKKKTKKWKAIPFSSFYSLGYEKDERDDVKRWRKSNGLAFSYSVPQIVSEDEIAGKGIGECVIEIQDFDELVPFDGVQIAISQCPHVGCWLTHRSFLPECVAEDVTFTCSIPNEVNNRKDIN